MGRGSYVVHNAFFDCGGPWGIIQTVLAAYIEERTGRPFHTFFDSLSGASIGGVNAIVLGLGIPARILGHAEYACSIDLFKDASETIVRNQIVNRKLGVSLLKDHHDHMQLYYTLAPHFRDQVMNDIKPSILVAAHNMEHKRNFWFGRMDGDTFDEKALKYPLINGTTPLLDAAMATTCIPGVFRPWEFNGAHYRDFGPAISAGKAHKELDSALQAKRAELIRARRGQPMNRRDALRLGFGRSSSNGPRTLENADGAVMRTLFVGTGDLTGLPYTKAVQNNAGFLGAVNDGEYSMLHMVKQNAQQEERADMERYFDAQTMRATGMPAITRINKSLVWDKSDPMQRETFPSLTQMDCTPGNLQKVFYFAGLNVEQHMTTIAAVLQEITINQLAQGKIDQPEYDRMSAICMAIAKESPWRILEERNILVTAHNGPGIYEKHRAHLVDPHKVIGEDARFGMVGRMAGSVAHGAAHMVSHLWKKPVAVP